MSIESNGCYGEMGVVLEYENKGLSVLENKIYSKYLIKKEAKILDIGCFVGRVSFQLAQRGYNVFGIDTASIAIKRANELRINREVNNLHFGTASAVNIPFKNEVFDYVLFPYNTIEGIPSIELRVAAMKEAARTLKKDGLILFSAHNSLHIKFLIGIILNEMFKVILKIMIKLKLYSLVSDKNRTYINEKANTEFGSIFIVEPGGTKYIKWHISTLKEIKKIITQSSLELIEQIPVMEHGPQRSNADILNFKHFGIIRVPGYYHICRKSERP